MSSPPIGVVPVVPEKDARVVMMPLPLASSNTVPSPPKPLAESYRLPLLSMIRPDTDMPR